MAGSATEVVLGTTPKMGRRSMALADIDPKYVSQSGIWEASEVETARGGSIRIQHLTAVSNTVGPRPLSTTSGNTFHGHHSTGAPCPAIGGPRFPKLEECAHFHYDIVELPHLKFGLREEQVQRCLSSSCTGSNEEPVTGGDKDKQSNFSIEVVSGGQCWIIRRTIENWIKLDEQLHRCVWDRNFSRLENLECTLKETQVSQSESKEAVEHYLDRLNTLPTNQITCGTVLSWLEIDNRGRHIISSDDAALNTPAVAAALATSTYTAQATDELSFRVGEMISVIDMPPPEESIWLRGKLTRESHEMGINFEVGFFPRECVEIIGEKGKFHGVPPVQTTRRLARVSVTSNTSSPIPDKPVLRKHGKIISFFRSMMSRPEKRVLQQKGILRERVFNCDLAEHLLNTSTEIPIILKTCSQFIELYGISDGIYRVSGSLRNTQRLRRLFDAEEVPNLVEDEGIRQDVHAVSSVLKQYFRELPNPLCTYQLYEKFVLAITSPSNKERFEKIKEVIKELPPPHYRTLEYLMLHLSKMTVYSDHTGMTAQNMAIVWAPNLIRCRDLEGGSAAEFKGVSNHVIVTEFVIRYAERFFGKDKSPLPLFSENSFSGGRPDSLLLSSSSPMKLMSLEAAKEKLGNNRNYIEVGGGPSSLPLVYHTVIDTSKRRSTLKSKGPMGSAGGWKNFFSRNRSFSKAPRKTTASDIRVVMNTAMNVKDGTVPGFGNKLRPVRSEESLITSPFETPLGIYGASTLENTLEVDESGEGDEMPQSTSSPASPVSDPFSLAFHHNNHHIDSLPGSNSQQQQQYLENMKTHNRSISHDSYFENSMKRLGIIPTEILEEETSATNSKLSLEMSSLGEESPQKERSSGVYGDCESNSSRATRNRSSFSSLTPPTNISSVRPTHLLMTESTSSEDSPVFQTAFVEVKGERDVQSIPNSPSIRPTAKPRLSKLRDCQVQTSTTAVNDVGVSTMDDGMTGIDAGRFRSDIVDMSLCRSVQNINRGNIDIYHYPTFNETEKLEISQEQERYELDQNSSVDDSSTDTTPGGDPYSVTNIIYSPLVNDISSPTTEESTEEEALSITNQLPNAQTRVKNVHSHVHEVNSGNPNRTNLSTRVHEYENVISVVPPLIPLPIDSLRAEISHYENEVEVSHTNSENKADLSTLIAKDVSSNVGTASFSQETQHYENLKCMWQFHQVTDETPKTSNLYETNIYEDIDEDDDRARNGNSYEDIEIKLSQIENPKQQAINSSTSQVREIQFDDMTYESVQFVNGAKPEIKMSGTTTIEHYTEIIEVNSTHVELEVVKKKVELEGMSPTASSGDGEESLSVGATEDSENITYFEIKDARLNSPEVNSQRTSSEEPSPVTEDSGEIPHIDSPLIVDNPLYGFQTVDIDTEAMSQEVQKLSQMYNNENLGESELPVKEKLVSRCNSAPLTDTRREFAMSLSMVTRDESGVGVNDFCLKGNSNSSSNESNNRKATRTSSSVREQQKLLLSKRLSEPSLNIPNNDTEKGFWKYTDAKRLTHRKQSVKELLTKFESTSQESVSVSSLSPSQSPTRASPLNNNNGANTNSNACPYGTFGPGLPRPSAKFTNHTTESNACLRDRNNTRYKHHRFSVGDILMSQSMNSSEEKNSINQSMSMASGTMSRSDTFPELRNEATKENESTRLDYSDKRSIIPEKMLQLFEVANTTVDNNDPNTRERIEKYKNNRRLFLREKYSGIPRNDSESQNSSYKSSSSSGGCADAGDRDSTSSIDSVFSLLPGSTELDRSTLSSSESPRKRALSEDISLHLQNQYKTFKSEGEQVTTSSSTLPLPDNKTQHRALTATTSKKLTEVMTTTRVSNSAKRDHPPLGSSSRLNIKSCPPGSLREDVISVTTTVTSVEVPTKCHWASSPSVALGRPSTPCLESGKKIKDIAAFFERKQF